MHGRNGLAIDGEEQSSQDVPKSRSMAMVASGEKFGR
jgi:hypothetical protein